MHSSMLLGAKTTAAKRPNQCRCRRAGRCSASFRQHSIWQCAVNITLRPTYTELWHRSSCPSKASIKVFYFKATSGERGRPKNHPQTTGGGKTQDHPCREHRWEAGGRAPGPAWGRERGCRTGPYPCQGRGVEATQNWRIYMRQFSVPDAPHDVYLWVQLRPRYVSTPPPSMVWVHIYIYMYDYVCIYRSSANQGLLYKR